MANRLRRRAASGQRARARRGSAPAPPIGSPTAWPSAAIIAIAANRLLGAPPRAATRSRRGVAVRVPLELGDRPPCGLPAGLVRLVPGGVLPASRHPQLWQTLVAVVPAHRGVPTVRLHARGRLPRGRVDEARYLRPLVPVRRSGSRIFGRHLDPGLGCSLQHASRRASVVAAAEFASAAPRLAHPAAEATEGACRGHGTACRPVRGASFRTHRRRDRAYCAY